MSPAREMPVLETARLILRPIEMRDADALHVPLSDAELMTWWSRGPMVDLEATRAYIDPEQRGGWRGWAITLGRDDTAIGWVTVGEKRQNVSEIGYILSRPHWGRGIACEAVSAVIDRIFAEGQRRVFADTDPENIASRTLLRRLGFKLEGYLRGEWETHLGVRDTTLYGLLRADWQARERR